MKLHRIEMTATDREALERSRHACAHLAAIVKKLEDQGVPREVALASPGVVFATFERQSLLASLSVPARKAYERAKLELSK